MNKKIRKGKKKSLNKKQKEKSQRRKKFKKNLDKKNRKKSRKEKKKRGYKNKPTKKTSSNKAKSKRRNKSKKKKRKQGKNKKKLTKKQKELRKRRMKNQSKLARQDSCSSNQANYTCMEAALKGLLFEQQQITNYLKQSKLLERHQDVSGNKRGKKNTFEEAELHLLWAIGGDIDNPICGPNDTSSSKYNRCFPIDQLTSTLLFYLLFP